MVNSKSFLPILAGFVNYLSKEERSQDKQMSLNAATLAYFKILMTNQNYHEN